MTFTLSILQGGFAKCYEMIDLNTNVVYAGKIIPHSRIAKGNQKQKVSFCYYSYCYFVREIMLACFLLLLLFFIYIHNL